MTLMIIIEKRVEGISMMMTVKMMRMMMTKMMINPENEADQKCQRHQSKDLMIQKFDGLLKALRSLADH